MSPFSPPDLADRLAALTPAKRARLEETLRARRERTRRSIPRRAGDGSAPLSFAQQRLFFLHQLEPDRPTYNVPRAIRLKGRLSVEALERALSEIVRRHETLRTTFSLEDGQPVQRVGPAEEIRLDPVDLRRLPSEDREARLRSLLAEEAARPFDLASGPALRAGLLRLSDENFVLTLTQHHIASDAWSADILLRELESLYPAFCAGASSSLPPLPIQYADFAEWQRGWLRGEVLDEQLAYWKRVLTDPPDVLELPADRPRPAAPTHDGGRLEIVVTPSLSAALRDFGRRERATPFMTLLAAFEAFLGRITQKKDFLLGAPIAGRNRRETEGLIGFFVNTLVFRADLSGDPSFRELLRRVRESALQAYAHQDLPFEKLVEELRPDRSLRHSPLFQVMFDYQNASRRVRHPPGITMSPMEIRRPVSHYDFSLGVSEREGQLVCDFSFRSDLFDLPTIRQMADRFRHLLEALAADPDQSVWKAPWMSPEERRQLLAGWHGARTAPPRASGVQELFEQQAARSPESVAAISGEARWTYAELNAKSNQVAHHLRRLGVRQEVRVGVCVPRGLDMLAALLGVLKAGGAYVPLDPTFPQERLAFLIEDSGAAVVLTHEELAGLLPRERIAIVRLDADRDIISREGVENPGPGAGPDDLAYVIYTSGSTGTPKGVEILHRSLLNYATGVSRLYGLTPSDRVLQFSSLSFDSAADEIFNPLTTGAGVVLRPDEMFQSASSFLEACRGSGVTALVFATAYWHELVGAMAEEGLRFPDSIRLVSFGGERAMPERLLQWHAVAGERVRLLNGYGPTEATITATFCDVTEWVRENPSPATVPIGKPIPNVQAYVLDSRGEPRPAGLPGELYLGGEGLARGYRNLPDETSARFVESPLPEDRGERLYRTGDLARYRPDGNLEFLGRLDDQVKVRGFRIELGEVESVLAQHPEVADAAVTVSKEGAGERRLIAYVVGRSASPPTSSQLRSFLKRRLPDYMQPSAFVALETLPLTPAGKLDRAALPEPEDSAFRDGEFVAPRNPIEEVLAVIWGNLLKLRRVGIEDDFFSLGGHSLIATRVISRIREAFGVELPLRSLFEARTIAGLAERIASETGEDSSPRSPLMVPIPRLGALPLSFAQQRLWFLDQFEPGNPFYNASLQLRLKGAIDADALEKAFAGVIARQESLRTSFDSIDGLPAQRIWPSVPFRLSRVDLSTLAGEERERTVAERVAEEASLPFDLTRAPLLRATLYRIEPGENALLVTAHHIVSDGWSFGILLRELAGLYAELSGGAPATLPELPIQYADFAAWQRRWLEGPVLEKQLAYWRERLARLPVVELATDRPRPPTQSFRGGRHTLTLTKALADGLTELTGREGATLYMTLLAAFQLLLSRYAGQEDIVVGSPIAGRTREEIEGLVGFFVNTLVLRTDLSGDPSFRELLRRVREVSLGAYAHQDVPFEKLVEELHPARDLASNPLFQILFALQNAPAGSLALPGAEATPVPIQSKSIRFDLEVYAWEGPAGLSCTFLYATDLFDAETIVRMTDHFRKLLENAVRDPDRRISELGMVSEAERRRVVEEWNRTAAEYPTDKAVHELFEERAGRTPEAVALICGEQRVTYGEVNERANRLAGYLCKRGVGCEVLVAVCLERSVEMVVSILGIWKAGGAYVPLDPGHPSRRLAALLEDSAARMVVTKQALEDRLPESARASALRLDAAAEEIGRECGENRASAVTGETLAYVLYTSGSTGVPKGVAIAHRSTVALLSWARSAYSREELSRVLASTSLSFDLSVFELFAPLAWGGAAVIASNVLELSQLPAAGEVTLVNTVPSAMRELLRTDGLPDSVTTVNLAGEPLGASLVAELLGRGTVGRVLDLYGPTEDTTYSTCALRSVEGPATIGRPISNKRAYILDARLQPVPVGVAGDLYLAGAGVARGYWNRADWTAERFLPEPFLAGGARMYRTGDRARYLPHGEIQFLGRRDEQVKLRGYRIELGEVEEALARHPGVADCAVTAREDPSGNRSLVGHVVRGGEARLSAPQMRNFLKATLPDYMVPPTILFLEKLPRTPTGKVDRKALPESSPERLPETFTPPRNPTEKLLAEIWRSVLRLERVGIEDDFFLLGGHSLLAMQILARLREAFRVQLPLRTIFEAPTVARLAAAVDAARRSGRGLAPPRISSSSRDPRQPSPPDSPETPDRA